jgi:hypothetical protein
MNDRHEPMPSLVGLPRWFWRRQTRRMRLACVALAIVASAAVVLFIVHGAGVRRDVRDEVARIRESTIARLKADQAPHHVQLTAAERRAAASGDAAAVVRVALERVVAADAAKRGGSLRASPACRRIHPVANDGRPLELPSTDAHYRCFATLRTDQTIAATLQSGYFYRARADLETLRFAWCKLNLRPIHADQEEFITVPVSPECMASAGQRGTP